MSGKLNFAVLVPKAHKKGGRNSVMSTIFVKMGPTVIASRTLPGKWTEEQAHAEFRKQPHLFKPKDATTFTPDILRRLAA